MATTGTIATILECKDTSEKIDLSEAHGLYIKPIARLNITIQLPPSKTAGQSMPTAEIIDKLRKHSQPEEYIMLRVIKSTLEYIRFEAEIENKSSLKTLLAKLDNSSMKMLSYTDVLKIRAAESKITYPLKHDWDTFFNCVNANVTELKPGERPDTIHLQDLPCKWFMDKKPMGFMENRKPSETILKDIFSIFGEIRCTDIPMLYNQKFYLQKSETFDAYVQYKEYFSFVKAMDTFRGMKMLHIDHDTKQAQTANIRVDFDRSKHLSEREIQRRSIDRLKAIEMEKIRAAQLEREKDRALKKQDVTTYKQQFEDALKEENNTNSDKSADEAKTKEQRRKEREEMRRQKRLAKKQQDDEKKLSLKIEHEERKILIAQRKLESMRLLEELFNRVKNSFPYDEYKNEDVSKDEDKNIETLNEEHQSLPKIEEVVVEKQEEENEISDLSASKIEEIPPVREEEEVEAVVVVDNTNSQQENEIAAISSNDEEIDAKKAKLLSTSAHNNNEEEKSPPQSRKKEKKEKKEKKRKRRSHDKEIEEYDLRDKIMRLKSDRQNSVDEEQDQE